MTMQKLKQLQLMPLSIKINMSKRRIREWYEYFNGKVYVSFSGGKDSTVLLHLVRSIYPDVKAVFIDTGLEYPEIRIFARKMKNTEVLRPKMVFPEVIKKYGYPIVSKNVARYVRDLQNPTSKNQRTRDVRMGLTGSMIGTLPKKWLPLVDAPFKISEQCCDVMKKRPIRLFEKETKMKPFIGMMAGESMARKMKLAKVGCNSFNQKKPQSNPLSFWLEEDILNYIVKFNVPYCKEIYGDIVEEKSKITRLLFIWRKINGKRKYVKWKYNLIVKTKRIYIKNISKLTTTKAKRTGCMFCMFGVHLEKSPNRFQQMKKSHPLIHNYCIDKLGCGKVMDYIGVKYN